jgi:DNA-binding YbaB/EbfC family protein
MKDVMGMMKQVQQMQAKMEALQAELEKTEVGGSAGGGLVTARMTAKGVVKGITIDPSLFKEDEKEIVEDLLIAALNDARIRGEKLMQEKMGAITAGLPIPPGMKLPF